MSNCGALAKKELNKPGDVVSLLLLLLLYYTFINGNMVSGQFEFSGKAASVPYS